MMHQSRQADQPRYIAALSIVAAVSTIVSMVSPLIVNALVLSTPLTLPQAGYATSLEMAGNCLGNGAAVLLARRIGPRTLIGVGSILMLIANLLCHSIGGFASFSAIRTAAGFGCGLTNVWAGLIVQTARPQRNYAIYMGVTNLAVAILGSCVPLLVRFKGAGAVYVAIAVFPLLCIAVLGLMPSSPAAGQHAAGAASRNVRPKSAASAMQFLFFFSLSIVWVFLSDFGLRAKISESILSTTVSLGWLFIAPLGSLAASYSEGKLSAGKNVFGSVLIFIAIVALLWFGHSPLLFCSAVILLIFVWAFTVPAMIYIVAEIDTSGELGTIVNLLAIVGFAVGPAVGAAILAHSTLGMLAAASMLGFAALLVTVPLSAPRSAFHGKRRMGHEHGPPKHAS